MLEVDSVGISLLIRQTAYLLQDGKMMADGINRITLITGGKCLIVVDELFRQDVYKRQNRWSASNGSTCSTVIPSEFAPLLDVIPVGIEVQADKVLYKSCLLYTSYIHTTFGNLS